MQRDGIVKSVRALIRRRAPVCIGIARSAPTPLNRAGGTFRPQSVAAKMVTTSRYLEAPRRLRAFVRAHETSLVVLAALVGIIGGLVVAAMSAAVEGLHVLLFNLQVGERLSSQFRIEPLRTLLVPSLGGLLLGVAFLLLQRWRPGREIDPIEANALHGGRMSFRGSVIVALQTVWSSGVGASVGLEAGYTQLASGLGASLGRGFHLRRADQRIMVGCGAAAAIAGAFGAPLAGAFYAFELVIGGYTPAGLAPVGVAAVAGYFVAHAFGELSLGVGARSAMYSGMILPLPRCSGFWRRCLASPSCAAWRSVRRCCRRAESGCRCARRGAVSPSVCSHC
jgi:H+/Cl- antiporter ClcA